MIKDISLLENQLESMKTVNKTFKIPKNTKRIKFGVIKGDKENGYTLEIFEGDYLGTKKFGRMNGAISGDTFYKVRIVYNEEEFWTYNVKRDQIIELIT